MVNDWRVRELIRLLGEATEHAIAEDGHCKSSEGAISFHFPAYPWREDAWPERIPEPQVEIFSYVLSSAGRLHTFDSIDEALAQVMKWHQREMTRARED